MEPQARALEPIDRAPDRGPRSVHPWTEAHVSRDVMSELVRDHRAELVRGEDGQEGEPEPHERLRARENVRLPLPGERVCLGHEMKRVRPQRAGARGDVAHEGVEARMLDLR